MSASVTQNADQSSLASAEWLRDARLQRLMDAIAGTDEDIRVVGGAVRNWLLGREVADVDLATTALPKTVIARARRQGLRAIPTGIDHGTITVIADGKPFEITTLRRDVATDGRHATVAFGRDWSADAHRRDFTVNALYATKDGDIIDLVGGIADIAHRRIRFIGNPDTRIREDYLRILRLFRFHAAFGKGPVDPEGVAACIRLREGVTTLSSERIGRELLKLVASKLAPDVLEIMQDAGILQLSLGLDPDLRPLDIEWFRRLHALLSEIGNGQTQAAISAPSELLLGVLAPGEVDGVRFLAERLRLSNAQRDRIARARSLAREFDPTMSAQQIRAQVYKFGRDGFADALMLAASIAPQVIQIETLRTALATAAEFTRPAQPVTGQDLIERGVQPGPALGSTLGKMTQRWIDSDFTLTKADLLPGLQSGSD